MRIAATIGLSGWVYIAPLLMAGNCVGQWAAAGVPFRIAEMGNIHSDTLGDVLYFCGESSLNNDFVMNDGAIPAYSSGQWDTLGVFLGRPQSAARWGDTLVVGGSFNDINGEPITSIAAYVNETWQPYGTIENYSIYRLKIVDGELYVLGSFTNLNGGSCSGIAKRSGQEWVPVGCLTSAWAPIVQDLVKWNGTLYITGSIQFGSTADHPKDVGYLDGDEWLPLGPGIQGSLGAGRSLAVYQDQLYVSGSIPIQAGNAGHGIMRWDGQQFHPVGTGFQGPSNDYTYLVGAVELEVHDDLLWAAGTFNFADHVPAPGIAYWDGSRWCGLPLGPEPEINTIEFFHDTLFASCHIYLDGEEVNCAVRFTGDHYSDTCSVTVGMPDILTEGGLSLRLLRRADGGADLFGAPAGEHAIIMHDAMGRLVHVQRVQASGSTSIPLALPPDHTGVLFISVGELGTLKFLPEL